MAILTVIKADETEITLPDPSQLQWHIDEVIGASGVNQSGDAFKDVINHKRTLNVSWAPMAQDDVYTILNAIDEPYFQLTFPDAKLGSDDTMTCEAPNPQAPVLSIINGQVVYSGLTITFKER